MIVLLQIRCKFAAFFVSYKKRGDKLMMKMPESSENIKPVSELRAYNKLLDEVKPDHPVILTKNGYGKYIVADLDDYEQMQKKAAAVELIQMMEKARQGKEYALEDIKKEFLGE